VISITATSPQTFNTSPVDGRVLLALGAELLDERERIDRHTEHSLDEPRSIVIGESTRGWLLFVVVTTDAEGKMRIISARRATKRERHAYEDE
jgi:uncharacterized DUF497 family protein